MSKLIRHLTMYMLCSVFMAAPVLAENSFFVISYHDVMDEYEQDALPGSLTIGARELIAQFNWLRGHGYQVISLDDVLAARSGKRTLPERSVLLSFDDGYRSVYTTVFPILKMFNYPAIVAPVTKWMNTPQNKSVLYGDKLVSREHFLTWEQLKEMADSGLVEIATHSHDLHHGIVGNPQGNLQPAATARAYLDKHSKYEDQSAYKKRIRNDLKTSINIIRQHTGYTPRAVIWPYGSYNEITVEIARSLGMPITLTLDDGWNTVDDLPAIKRGMMPNGANLQRLVWMLEEQKTAPVRVVHVDLDYIYDTDAERQEHNLSKLIERIKSLKINTVYLQAFADPDGNGSADALYFPNRHLPVRADLFNRVAWQLRSLAGVKVYGWLPVLAYELAEDHALSQHQVESMLNNRSQVIQSDYHRLSPFSEQARDFVGDIYEDLAAHADVAGILFHDDAYLNDYEDASSYAITAYQKRGLPASVEEIRANPELFGDWSKYKTQVLIEWTNYLGDRVRQYRPGIKTARNLYARVITQPQAEQWFAQSLPSFLEAYDYTAVMAMPYLEGVARPRKWLDSLVEKVASIPGALNKTVFELQSVNWKKQEKIQTAQLAGQMTRIQSQGVTNYGYYPDDFVSAHPQIEEIIPSFSLNTFPYR